MKNKHQLTFPFFDDVKGGQNPEPVPRAPALWGPNNPKSRERTFEQLELPLPEQTNEEETDNEDDRPKAKCFKPILQLAEDELENAPICQ